MNRDTLSQLIKNPSLLTAQHEAELKQMLKVYPYFQTLFVLYAKANSSSESIEKAAVRTLDRNLLRRILTKNFNPNQTDAFTTLLKNTEQVNAFERLRAEAKEEKRKAEIQDNTSEVEIENNIDKQDISSVLVSFNDDESAGSIIYNNQNDFSSLTQTELPKAELPQTDEPTYNPFASDIFDKNLSTGEIVIDEDVKIQTPSTYDDDLVKPLLYDEIEKNTEPLPQHPPLKNYIISTDNFFGEVAVNQEEEELDLTVKDTKNLDNFFEVPDFSEIDEAVIEPEKSVTQISSPLLDTYETQKEETIELIENSYYQEDNRDLESSFFDFNEVPSFDFNETATEKEVALLDTYFLRKEEEATTSENITNQAISDEIAISHVAEEVALLDTYFLRKEEEATTSENIINQAISNEIAISHIAEEVALLDTYFLRKEEEATTSENITNQAISDEIAISHVAEEVALLDTYFLRKEEEATTSENITNQAISDEIAISQVAEEVALLDTYFLRKEEEALEIIRTKNEIITNEVAHNEDKHDRVLVATQVTLLDAYYLRKEEESFFSALLPETEVSPDINVEVIDIALLDTYYLRKEEEMIDFEGLLQGVATTDFSPEHKPIQEVQFLDNYYLRKEEESDSVAIQDYTTETVSHTLADDNIGFFTDVSEIEVDFDTTNFFDDTHHDHPSITTAKPVYKKVNQEYQRSLIDKFIKESPTIHIDRDKMIGEVVDLAEESTRENLQVVSERLAKIYALQGRNRKAIEIYQRLAEQNPDKSSYFLAQITNLENL
ncbi:MAG: hypothetical protein EAZ08_00535 [Cytophagales bacterium]|nr:MAG: hypothetical protein EAZ08_00535 [Cytophagales bacterium]